MFEIETFVYGHFDDVGTYGHPVTDLTVNCMHCAENGMGDDTKHHLNISINKQVVHCFRCGYKATWIGFVMDVTGYVYHKALGLLYTKPKVRDLDSKLETMNEAVAAHRKNMAGLPQSFIPLHTIEQANPYRHYMKLRGFDMAVCKHYNIGKAEEVPGRVIIPIENGYWQGRAMYKWLEPKYLNPKNPASDIIFNAGSLGLYDEVVICEGAFSAMAVGYNALALIGKEPTHEKMSRLLQSEVSHFIIALEPKAIGTMGKLANQLYRNGKEVTIWEFTSGDPADPKGVSVVKPYDMRFQVLSKLMI